MSYVDYYLKAPTADVYDVDIDGAIDVIGEIEGVEGYHANLRLREGVDVPDSLKPFLIDAPEHPKRVWA